MALPNQKLTSKVDANQMQKMQMIANDLVKFHLGNSFQFQWKFNIKASGLCWRTRGLIEVSIRDAVTRGMDEFVETVLHEIAHGLCNDYSNKGHNQTWRSIYLSIGGNGTVTTDESIAWESKHRLQILIDRGLGLDPRKEEHQ